MTKEEIMLRQFAKVCGIVAAAAFLIWYAQSVYIKGQHIKNASAQRQLAANNKEIEKLKEENLGLKYAIRAINNEQKK